MANPANDTLESFLDRLCQNAEEFLRDAKIGCRFDLAADLPPLPLSLEKRRNLLLVVREALNNIVKHSGATEVLITVRRSAGNLELMIQDNGRGFDAGNIRSGAMGLSGMRRRTEGLDGQFEVENSPGAGTTIRIQVKWQTTDHEQSPE
jgi:signal transduction histidine kinase